MSTTQDLSKLTKEQLIKLMEKQVSEAGNKDFQVKLNSGGGVYIRHSSFKEYSHAKDKEYIAGINIPYNTAKILFNDPKLIEAIKKKINELK